VPRTADGASLFSAVLALEFGSASNDMSYLDRITIEAGKRGGKPCIRGMRITVYDVLEYLASGMTEAQILSDFPELAPEDIRAVYEFAAERERRLVTHQS
jgi:uncharacterized protein (DUF433 family)